MGSVQFNFRQLNDLGLPTSRSDNDEKLGNQTKLTEHELKAQLSSTYTTVTDFPLSMLYTRLPSSYVQMLSILQCNINHVISHALQ